MMAILVLSSPQDLAPTRTPYILNVMVMCFQIEMNRLVARLCLEFLFSVYWYEGSTKFKSCNSNICILANSFFKPTNKVVSSVTHRTYYTNYEKSYVTCNSGLPHTVGN